MQRSRRSLDCAARALTRANGKLLYAFDRRTVAALRNVAPLRPVLAHLEPMLVLNLAKEMRKDALVVAAAVAAVADGRVPAEGEIDTLLNASRGIDQEFLSRVGSFPVRIVIRYEDVLPLRRRRSELLLTLCYRVLTQMRDDLRLRAALKATYGRDELEAVLGAVLRLYTSEVRILSRAVQLPLLLLPLRELAATRLSLVMSDVADRLVRDAVSAVLRR